MKAFGATILIDRNVKPSELATAFQQAHGLGTGQVLVGFEDDWQQDPRQRLPEGAQVNLLIRPMDGEFQLYVDWISWITPDVQTVLSRVARTLEAVVLTDLIEVNPLSDDWFAIGPGGTTAILANTEDFWGEDPVFRLEPRSRAAYEALRAMIAA